MSGLDRIREAARKDKSLRFTSLMHHITIELLRDSYLALNRRAVPGVADVTWRQYGEQLEDRLPDLHERVQSGRYRAMPSKRVWKPKPDGRQRPIGIAVLEDKIAQQAVVVVLNQIYEEAFLGFSYGFRPNRHPHRALDAVWVGITQRKVNWVLDADIRGFFDNIDHEWLMRFLEHRIADPGVLRLIGKWLRAGVSEEGQWSRTEVGTPQGSVISPLLANIYLHYVLDLWVDSWRKRVRGDVIIVRYADDWIMGFQYQKEAELFLGQLRERLAKFGWRCTKRKPASSNLESLQWQTGRNEVKGSRKRLTFWVSRTYARLPIRQKGFTIRRKTIAKRLRAKVKEVRAGIVKRMHDPVPEQGQWLRSVLNGHLNYYAVPGNIRSALMPSGPRSRGAGFGRLDAGARRLAA